MGSSVSVKSRDTQQVVRCQKHPNNVVTHYVLDSDQLICLTCFNGISRTSTGIERNKCVEINSYIESVVFKQSENRAVQSLRTVKEEVEKEKNKAKALMSDVIQKRSKLQREVKGFVDNVIALLKFLETDLIKTINSSFQKVLDDVGSNLNKSRAELESIVNHESAMGKKRDRIVQLQAMIAAKNYVTNFREVERTKLPNPSFVLKLNKRLTLKQIIGNEEGKSTITLGDLRVDNNVEIDDQSIDILSDVTEGDTIKENIASKRRTNRFTESNRPGTETAQQGERKGRSSTVGHLDSRIRQDSRGGELHSVEIHEQNTPDNIAIRTKSTRPEKIQNRTTIQDNSRIVSSSSMAICRLVKDPSNIVPQDSTQNGSRARPTTSVGIQESGVTPRYYSVQSRLSSRTPRSSKLSITTPSGVALTDRPIIEDDEEFVQTHFEKCGQFELPSSILKRNITASIELENGDIVVCDQRNKEVLLLGSSMTHKSRFTFSSNPHNITNIGRDKIAVTLPEENFIMVLEIDHDIIVESDYKILTTTKCRGIEHADDKIFYTLKNSVYIKDGENSYRIERAFKQPVSLTSERNKHVLHVCCRGNKLRDEAGEVVTLDTRTARVVSTLFHGQLKDPVSCTVDQYGDMYICDVQPPSCIHVTRHGEYSHVVLGSVHEKYQHIRYIRHRDCFMITENDCNFISLYKLTRNC